MARVTGSHFELQTRQPGVKPALIAQIGGCADFDDAALFQHDDAIGFLHGGEAVGDDESGASFHRGVESLLHQYFGFGVERAGGFVEQQQRCVLQDRAGDRDALALATGETGAAFAEKSSITVRQAVDEDVHQSRSRGGHHFRIAGGGAAVADVFQGVGREDHRILRDDGDFLAQVVQREVADVLAVEANAARRDVVKTQQELEEGGFARAGRSDQGYACAGRDGEIDVARAALCGRAG